MYGLAGGGNALEGRIPPGRLAAAAWCVLMGCVNEGRGVCSSGARSSWPASASIRHAGCGVQGGGGRTHSCQMPVGAPKEREVAWKGGTEEHEMGGWMDGGWMDGRQEGANIPRSSL